MRRTTRVALGALALMIAAPRPPGWGAREKPAPAERGSETGAGETIDLSVVHRIKDEAFRNGRVMDHLFFLTDVNGPRLTGSPGFRSAAEWAARTLKEWGITSARVESWGPFGRGWSLVRYAAHLQEPAYAPLPGVPEAWSGGTRGAVTGAVVSAPLFTPEEEARDDSYDVAKLAARIAAYSAEQKGRLRGTMVLIDPAHPQRPPARGPQPRYDERQLAQIAEAPELFVPPPLEWPITRLPEDPVKRRRLFDSIPYEVNVDYYERWVRVHDRLNAFLRDEGVLAVLSSDRRDDAGVIFTEQAASWFADAPLPPPVIALPAEPYDRLSRLVEHRIPVKVELEVEVKTTDGAVEGQNVVAEIPGGRRSDEVVMLGAHLDSWHGGTGATDNAAGCAVALEAMRILKALDLRMDRTVRVALWGGEEQSLYGSRRYVAGHFGDPVTMAIKPEHARLSGYFNVDNGTGRIRGVYLQGNDMMRPVFEAWLAPFRDLGVTTITIAHTTDTDHESFDGVGLPGFQFIQDPLDYESRTHHSDLDVYDHVQAGDLMQAAAVLASCVYDAATRPGLLPRKPLPKPLPKKKPAEF